MPLSQEDVASIETVKHYTHDEDQAYLMLYGPRRAARCPCLIRARPYNPLVTCSCTRPRRT